METETVISDIESYINMVSSVSKCRKWDNNTSASLLAFASKPSGNVIIAKQSRSTKVEIDGCEYVSKIAFVAFDLPSRLVSPIWFKRFIF